MIVIVYWLLALILTILIEVFIAYILKIKNASDIKKIIFINICTNLPLNILVTCLGYVINYNVLLWIIVPVLEVFVFLIEGYYFKKLSYKLINSYSLSFVLNSISYLIGVIYLLVLNLIK